MTALYREVRNLTDGTLLAICRVADNAFIPLVDGNKDYVDYMAWVAAGNIVDADPNYTPELIKSRKWNEIKEQRDNRKESGVKVGTLWYHTDDTSRIQWLALKDTARDNIAAGGAMTDVIKMLNNNLQWKTMSGDFTPVTNQLAFDVVQATKNMDAVLFGLAEQKRAEVNASTDPLSYVTNTGWPQTFAEATATA